MACYQSFDPPNHRAHVPARLQELRAWMTRMAVDGFLIADTDSYLCEFINPTDMRLAWTTGFTGSTGTGLILTDRALLFLDGRYLHQGRMETDKNLFEIINSTETSVSKWLGTNLAPGTRIGYDPWLHSITEVRAWAKHDIGLVPVGSNPIDQLWAEQPIRNPTSARLLPLDVAGESCFDKRHRIATELREQELHATLLSAPDSVNWLFNIRGRDIPHTPIVQARAVLYATGETTLFIDPTRVSTEIADSLGAGAQIKPERELQAELRRLAGREVSIDSATVPKQLSLLAESLKVHFVCKGDPVARTKAVKNSAEIDGARLAHQLDAQAMVEFLAWLDAQPFEELTEIDIVEALEQCRADTGQLDDISFDTIAAAGPNAAMPHYRVTRASNQSLRSGEFLLIDSGGQYRMGTTDITRTIPLGNVRAAMCESYTTVLQAMITLSTARFPPQTSGIALDTIARQVMWRAGLNYDHGTGHGVGAGLSVHEGPIRVSPRGDNSRNSLTAGHIISNEPGFYLADEYGIRIENLLLVGPAQTATGQHTATHGFETLTLVPIDTSPVIESRLDPAARDWLNQYHQRVLQTVGPNVSARAQAWLQHACQPI